MERRGVAIPPGLGNLDAHDDEDDEDDRARWERRIRELENDLEG